MAKEYTPKAETSEISFTSRCALKIKDNYYTIEATEKRNVFPDMEGIDLEKEWDALCDSVNAIVDNQANDIINTFKRK